MCNRIYNWLHRCTSRKDELGEYSAGYWQDKIRKTALSLCGRASAKILEVGCGEGLFLIQLAKNNPRSEIWGVDNSAERLQRAEARIKAHNISTIRLSLQEATGLSFDDESFDIIVCINVFFNMGSIDQVRNTLNQMKRICKKSGTMVFDFRNSHNPLLAVKYRLARYYDSSVKDLPLRTYSRQEVESLLEGAGLKILSRTPVGFFLTRYAPIIIIEAQKA